MAVPPACTNVFVNPKKRMFEFYKKAALVFFCLVLATLVLFFFMLDQFSSHHVLLPADKSIFPLKIEVITDVDKGGTSSTIVNSSNEVVNYDYRLTDAVLYPHVTLIFALAARKNSTVLTNLSGYNSATFKVKCRPNKVLVFHLHSFDDQVTDPQHFSTYRIAETLFSCNDQWSEIHIDLRFLNVPLWWLETYEVDTANQDYWLDKVVAFSMGASRRGPINTPANVLIRDFTLHKNDWVYRYVLLVMSIINGGGYSYWFVRQYTKQLLDDVESTLLENRPLLAYQQLSIKPHKNKEKTSVLTFIANEYTNENMNLEAAINRLGINRRKTPQ